jgi:hypothetical protein
MEAEGRVKSGVRVEMSPVMIVSVSRKRKGASGIWASASILLPWG